MFVKLIYFEGHSNTGFECREDGKSLDAMKILESSWSSWFQMSKQRIRLGNEAEP